MTVYLSMFLILICIGITELITKRRKLVFISGTLLGLMAGLRYYTGYDFTSYREYFLEADRFTQLFDGSIRLEPGYLFFVILFRNLGFNYYTFVLFFSLASLAILTLFLYKNVKYPTLPLIYYYARYFMARDMGQVRASLVAIILLFAIPYILKKEPLKFFGIVFIAAMFHYSALIFIGVYIIHLITGELTVKKSFLLAALALSAGVIIQTPSLFIGLIPESYQNYFTMSSHTSGAWLMYPVLWMQCLIFAMSFYFNQDSKSEEKEWYNLLLTTYLLAILALIATGRLETVGGRISTLFATVEILLVPFLFRNLTKYNVLNFISFIGFTGVVFVLIFLISGMYQQYIPYETIFH